MSELATVDREVIDIANEVGGDALTTRDIDPVLELKRFEAAVQLQTKLIAASIKVTKPQDWVEMGGKVYLQGTGVERMAPLWGLVFGEPTVERQDLGNGDFAYVVRGPVGCRRTGVFYKSIEGGRSSDDPFFDRFDEERPSGWRELSGEEKSDWRKQHRIKPDELDVRKAAVTNWQTRAASMLTGMRGLTMADLKASGLDGVKSVEFNKGGAGGQTASADVTAERTKLRNALLERTGGDTEAAVALLVDITKTDKFSGWKSVDKMTLDWQFKAAWKALAAHPTFGDK